MSLEYYFQHAIIGDALFIILHNRRWIVYEMGRIQNLFIKRTTIQYAAVIAGNGIFFLQAPNKLELTRK